MVKQLALRDCSEYPKGQGLYGPYKADKGMKTFKGGFALVHQVVKQTQDFNDPQADQQAFYALKEIRIRDKHQCELVHREVEILKKVNHSNILALEEAFYVSDPRIIFLATQPWAPLSLEILLRNALEEKFEPWHNSGKSWPWQSIISQCIRGVGYLHTELSKPIKHKDLKPQNILLHVEGHLVRPIIADFGLSKEWENGCPTDNSGTAQFKAPEQLQHDDSKLESDIWALGCCFSLILSLLNESNISLLELWEIGVGPVKTPSRDQESNPGFFNNLDKIIKILGRTCGSSFADLFRRLILEMLLSEPKHRPNARDLDIQFVQLFHLPNLLLSWLYIGEKGGQIWRNNPHLQF
jgi:serine/threonine protein kinase